MLGLRTIIVAFGLLIISCEITESSKSRNSSDHETKQKKLEKIIAQDGMSDQDKDFIDLQLIRNDKKAKLVSHNSVHHQKSDPCYFKRCYPGQKCQVNPQTGRASCICKTHCKNANKPLCGTDGKFYVNHCEMYRESCTSMQNIYDARNKDCFYKRSECSAVEFEAFLVHFLEYHESSVNYMRHSSESKIKNVSKEKTLKRTRRSRPGRIHTHLKKTNRIEFDSNEIDLVPPPSNKVRVVRPNVVIPLSTLNPKEIDVSTGLAEPRTQPTELISETTFKQADRAVVIEENPQQVQAAFDASYTDDVITSDDRGDSVKSLFKFIDLDVNDLVGSEEMYELVMFENLDTVIPPPCSVFHLLNFADKNNDRYLDLHEIFAIYNVTILQLDDKDREVHVVAQHKEDITLHCGIQGEAAPVWRRYGYDLNVYSAPNVMVDDAYVEIKGITPEFAGNYTCHARKRPDIFQVIILSVHIGPQAEIYPRNQHIIEGNSVTVFCHANGIPTPSITWLINGEEIDVDDDRYVMMGNNSELHLNSVDVTDSAAYSCVANNGVDSSEEIAAIFVEDSNQSVTEFGTTPSTSFIAFHNDGIRIINPLSCQELRNIHSTDTVPGLLRQNKLCKVTQDSGQRECVWGTAITTGGSRLVYATQPNENRIVVVDNQLQRVVEILATDESPISLHYVKSSDQLFVFCHNDDITGRSTIQVIYAASVPGAHSATQIQPLEGGSRVDLAIQAFFIPDEGIANLESKYAYVSHKNDQVVYKLNLSTLLYETGVIDLNPYSCIPIRFSYQPIGGRLDVTCVTIEGERPRTLTIEQTTDRVIDLNQDTGYDREFVSKDSRHLIRVFPSDQIVKIYNVSTSGDINESIVLHTNFRVADAIFVETLNHVGAATIYISSKDQGDLMYMDAASGAVEVIGSLSPPIETDRLPSEIGNRKLTSSAWYDSHVAVGGITELEIINVINNEISCRFDDLIETTAIAWVDEMK